MSDLNGIRILTNNPLVHAKYQGIAEYLEADAEGVLLRVRDRIHLGASIVNHPLSGGMPPGVCPFKSLILTYVGEGAVVSTDFTSLDLIEGALRALKRTPSGFKGYSEETLSDFQVLDLDLVDSALQPV